jgi:hypothetical protein
MNEEMTTLMHKHLNSTLSAAEAATLANAMLEDPGLAEEFAALTRMEADLTAAMKDGERTALYTRRMERAATESGAELESSAGPVRKRWRVKTVAAAAGFAVMLGTGWSVMESLNRTTAKKSAPGPSGGGGTYASAGGGSSKDTESAAMKKRLRRFYVPMMTVRSQPVSQALAHLQSQYRDAAPKDDKDAAAFTFALSDKLRQRWVKPDDEPVVSLEIPGVSMLTNVELLAAQAGLKPVITSGGVMMEDDSRAGDGKERKWTIPLPKASLAAFVQKSTLAANTWKREVMQHTVHYSFSMGEAARGMELSWMKAPQMAGGDNPMHIVNYWADGLAVDSAAQQNGNLWGLVSQASAATNAEIALNGVDSAVSALREKNELKVYAGDTITSDTALPLVTYILGDSADVVQTVAGTDFTTIFNSVQSEAANQSAALVRLLALHGMPAEGLTYDAEAGMLTARGSMQSLRAANAAVAAIQESTADGVSAEMRIIEWNDQVPPETTASSEGKLLTSGEVQALLRLPNAGIASAPRTTVAMGSELVLKQAPKRHAKGEEREETAANASSDELILKVTGTRPGAGDTMAVQVNIAASGGDDGRNTPGGTPGADVPLLPRSSAGESRSLKMSADGGWLRFDFPGGVDRKALTALVRIQSGTAEQ